MTTRSSPDDLMAEFAETVPYYKVFIARKRAGLRAKLAEIQENEEGAGDPLPPVSLLGAFDTAMPSVLADALTQTGDDLTTGTLSGMESQAAEIPAAPPSPHPATSPVVPLASTSPDYDRNAPPADMTHPAHDSERETDPAGDAGADLTDIEVSTLPSEATGQEGSVTEADTADAIEQAKRAAAHAALEATLSAAVVATLPHPLREGWRRRYTDRTPWVQVLLAAWEERRLPEPVAQAVAGMVEADPEFRAELQLLESGLYPEFFEFDWDVIEGEAE
jgi:hypothetical protein